MFTGIVGERGKVTRARMRRGVLDLEIESRPVARELEKGASVAVNGVCLTATFVARKRFSAQAVPETLARSTLGGLAKGAPVNLELPARPVDRLGGHIVQGHVDGTARVVAVGADGEGRRLTFEAKDDIARYVVPKGSVAVDGVSLTVASATAATWEVAVIPHTLGATTLGDLAPGDLVNIEVDILAKYVERLSAPRP